MNSDGSNENRITDNSSVESNPSWSTTNDKIIFQSDRDEKSYWELYIMNSNGTSITRLTNTETSNPHLNPNNSYTGGSFD